MHQAQPSASSYKYTKLRAHNRPQRESAHGKVYELGFSFYLPANSIRPLLKHKTAQKAWFGSGNWTTECQPWYYLISSVHDTHPIFSIFLPATAPSSRTKRHDVTTKAYCATRLTCWPHIRSSNAASYDAAPEFGHSLFMPHFVRIYFLPDSIEIARVRKSEF